MAPMSKQNPLPFPGEESQSTPADTVPASPRPAPARTSTAARARASGRPPPAVGSPAGPLVEPWLSLKIEPEDPGQYNDGRPVVYVLEDYGLSNALIWTRPAARPGCPRRWCRWPVTRPGASAPTALSRRSSSNSLIPEQRGAKTHSDSLAKVLQAHRVRDDTDVHLVPVSIFVGRAPDKQSGWFAVLFSENWALVGRFRRLLGLLLNGRNTIVRFARRSRCAAPWTKA